MEYKKCSKCGKEKPLSEYGPHKRTRSGVQPSCRACAAALAKQRYHKDMIYRLANLKQSRKQRKEKGNELREYRKQWQRDNREEQERKYGYQRKAKAALNNAIARGKIVRSSTCRINNGNCTKIIQAHHTDYNKPLDVEWLCSVHHMAWHRVFEAERNSRDN